jgi:hypothetical protein
MRPVASCRQEGPYSLRARIPVAVALCVGLFGGAATFSIAQASVSNSSASAASQGSGHAAATKPSISMIALGDSYSSGTGVGPGVPGCDRDRLAYAPRARNDILPKTHRVTRWTFVACAGATIDDLLRKQVDSVRSGDNVASLTIGGNDIHFAEKLFGCRFGNCESDVFSLQADKRDGRQTWDDLYAKLVVAYRAVRGRMARNGHLYVLTYPIPFSRESTADCNGLNATEQNAANALVTRLDDTMYWAVLRANQLRQARHLPGNVHFVDWRTGQRVADGYTIPRGYAGAGRKFATYRSPDGLCGRHGRNPFINGYIAPPNHKNSFHPKSNGYWKGAQLFAAAVRKYQPVPANDGGGDNGGGDPTNPTPPPGASPTPGGQTGGSGTATSGKDTVGIYRPSDQTWHLTNGLSDHTDVIFHYGNTNDLPVTGDWNGDGKETVGIYRPSDQTWHLTNGLSDHTDVIFHYGNTNDLPVTGDWNG